MKNKLLLSLLLGFGCLNAWAEPEPAPPASKNPEPAKNANAGVDPFAPGNQAPSPPQLAQVQVEFVELSHETLTNLLFLRSPKSADATDLRKKVQDLVLKKEAKVLETQILVCKSSQKATSESIHEFIYPTEYTLPTLPQAPNDSNGTSTASTPLNSSFPVTPGDPTSFATRNVGGTLEVEPTIGDDNRTIDVRFVPEFIWHTGDTVWHEGKDSSGNPFKKSMPDFYDVRMNTAITCIDGQYTFVGALSPKNDKGELDTSRKLMVFVKCDVLEVK